MRLRVCGEPFTITGRGIGVLCEPIDDGAPRFGATVTVAVPDPGGADVEARATVEAARVDTPERELPALFFRVAAGSEREAQLRRLLRPGTTLSVAAAAD